MWGAKMPCILKLFQDKEPIMTDLNPLAWNWNQAKSAGKHVASYAAGGVTMFVAFHILSPAQGTDITTDINLITEGLAKVATGVAGIIAVLVPVYTALRAAHNSSPVVQAQSLEQAVPGTVVITTPAIAAATPESPNIMSNTEVKVVQK